MRGFKIRRIGCDILGCPFVFVTIVGARKVSIILAMRDAGWLVDLRNGVKLCAGHAREFLDSGEYSPLLFLARKRLDGVEGTERTAKG